MRTGAEEALLEPGLGRSQKVGQDDVLCTATITVIHFDCVTGTETKTLVKSGNKQSRVWYVEESKSVQRGRNTAYIREGVGVRNRTE